MTELNGWVDPYPHADLDGPCTGACCLPEAYPQPVTFRCDGEGCFTELDEPGLCVPCFKPNVRRTIGGAVKTKGFPVGARVLVDGRDEAIVKQFFPEGSSSYLWPHYKLDFIGGDRNVAVALQRVGVTPV